MESARPVTERFSDRAADYVRGRPGYPAALYDALLAATGLAAGARIADLGSGTGLSSAPFLDRGFQLDQLRRGWHGTGKSTAGRPPGGTRASAVADRTRART